MVKKSKGMATSAIFSIRSVFNSKRIVLKIGSSLLTQDGNISPKKINHFVHFVTLLMQEGREVIIVSSGAIASAKSCLLSRDEKDNHLSTCLKKNGDVVTRQALASIGQVSLMEVYRKAFAKKNIMTGQILFSKYSIQHKKAYLNARNTITRLLSMGVVPIINENDPLAVDEIRFGDNDVLGALVCGFMEADLYVILSNVDGFYLDGKRIDFVQNITKDIQRHALGAQDEDGTGGMLTKLNAVKLNYRWGIPTFLTKGSQKNLYQNVFENFNGTIFFPPNGKKSENKKISTKKRWILAQSTVRGKLFIDKSAEKSLYAHLDLLAKGIVNVKGRFHTGDVVDIVSLEGKKLGQGLTHFENSELVQILGHSPEEFEKILGCKTHKEVIHRTNLVLMSGED